MSISNIVTGMSISVIGIIVFLLSKKISQIIVYPKNDDKNIKTQTILFKIAGVILLLIGLFITIGNIFNF